MLLKRSRPMKRFFVASIMMLLLANCTKEEVTKIVQGNNPGQSQPTSTAQAQGTINGGGGKGVMCKHDSTTTVETLDLYEARVLYDLKIEHKVTSQDQALDLAASLLTQHLWNPSTIAMKEYTQKLREELVTMYLKNIKFISAGKKLNVVADSFEPLLEKNCEMVQVAIYYDESIILIDESLWDQMDWTDKIGLITHEIIYYLDRQNGSTNSVASRKLVGELFSTKGARAKSDGIPKDKSQYVLCDVIDKEMSVGYFYAYDFKSSDRTDKRKNGLEFNFNYLKNNDFLFRTSAFFKRVDLAQFFDENYRGTESSDLVIDGYPPKQKVRITFLGLGKAKMNLVDIGTEAIEEFQVTCRKPNPESN